MSELIIAGVSIRQDSQNRYCLNDLHKAAGNQQKHRPKYWLENQQTKDLVAEIEKGGIPPIESKQQLGTFAVKPLVYAYAMWISPAFNLHVIEAYDALVTTNSLSVPNVLTPAQFEHRLAAILEAQEALNRATIQMSVAEYEALLDQRTVYHVPGKALALMEKYGIPRDEICTAAGINRNNLRQHLFYVRKEGGV